MQKYYALSDVFNALGKMGGAAVGGAIGGNAFDNAPATEPYKESRGYLEAFEKSKQADERLRKLDDTGFQLLLNKQQRDEDRAYNEKMKLEDRAYQAEQNRINREFQAEQARLNREWNKANEEGNIRLRNELEKELANLRHQNDMALQRLRNQGALDEKRVGQESTRMQYDLYQKVPMVFDDGSGIEIESRDYDGLKRRYIGRSINGRLVTKDNIDMILGQNPQLVKDYFNSLNRSITFTGAQSAGAQPQPATQHVAQSTSNADNTANNNNTTSFSPWYYDTVKAQAAEQQKNKPKNLVEQNPATTAEDIEEFIKQYE